MRRLGLLGALALVGCGGPAEIKLDEVDEYYAGRAMAASTLRQYKLYATDEPLTEYVNLIGLLMAQVSDRPEIYNGYHFVVLDADHVNAFASAGGFIFITTGAILACHDEDELAGILAHEVAHVALQHPELQIRKEIESRKSSGFFRSLGSAAIGVLGGGDLAGDTLGDLFGDVIDEYEEMMAKGFSRDQELEADRLGAVLLARAGYDPGAMTEFIGQLTPVEARTEMIGWNSNSHPAPAARVEAVTRAIGEGGLTGSRDPRRKIRFRQNIRSLKNR